VAEPAPNEAEGPRRERQKAKRQFWARAKLPFCRMEHIKILYPMTSAED
jgi:hypothetical protein